MALEPAYLVDKSALARVHLFPVRVALEALADAGLIATCSIIDLEVGYSAKNSADHNLLIGQRRQLPLASINQDTLDRALDLQGLLAHHGSHRVPLPDLIIAACAQQHGLTVIHYDSDFDTIQKVTGQPTRWVVPRGSL